MIENGGDQSGPDHYDVNMKYSESHAVTKFITKGRHRSNSDSRHIP